MQPSRIVITDNLFQQSYQDGVSWGWYGDMPALSDNIIVEHVCDNILGGLMWRLSLQVRVSCQ
jgi:hypothetical protein